MLIYQILWQIIEGERLTLTLWFSRDSAHDEDAKLISLLSEKMLHGSNDVPISKLPMLASSNMYWFSPDPVSHQQSGFDICCARMHVLGFDIYSSQGKNSFPDLSELLMEPLQLARGNELYDHKFVNILLALQVYFSCCSLNLTIFVNSQRIMWVTRFLEVSLNHLALILSS